MDSKRRKIKRRASSTPDPLSQKGFPSIRSSIDPNNVFVHAIGLKVSKKGESHPGVDVGGGLKVAI